MSHDADPSPPAGDDIAAQAAMYRSIVENSIDMIVCYSPTRERTYISPACREVVGREPSEMIGLQPSEFVHPADFPLIHPSFLAFGPDMPHMRLTFRVSHKDGRWVWVEVTYRYMTQHGTSVAVFRDITHRKNAELMLEEANEKLESANRILRRLAQQDGLTGLANRRRFDEHLELEFRRAARQRVPLAVILIDVDRFKLYNDRYGHLAGDDCLRRVASRLQQALDRAGDHLARYGGEEFVALLPATDLTGAVTVAERLREAVAELMIPHADGVLGITSISVGASAVIPYEDDDPAHLLEAADQALYRAEADGRNRVRGSEAGVFAGVIARI